MKKTGNEKKSLTGAAPGKNTGGLPRGFSSGWNFDIRKIFITKENHLGNGKRLTAAANHPELAGRLFLVERKFITIAGPGPANSVSPAMESTRPRRNPIRIQSESVNWNEQAGKSGNDPGWLSPGARAFKMTPVSRLTVCMIWHSSHQIHITNEKHTKNRKKTDGCGSSGTR